MKLSLNLILFFLLLNSCKKLDLNIDEDTYKINSGNISFNTILTQKPQPTALLLEVKLSALVSIDTIKLDIDSDKGFFYSTDSLLLYSNDTISIDDLKKKNSQGIYWWDEDITVNSTGNGFEGIVKFPSSLVGEKIFVRAYVEFTTNSDLTRQHIAVDSPKQKITLKDGWFKKDSNLKIENRQHAFAFTNPEGNRCIVGTGCGFESECRNGVNTFNFLSFPDERFQCLDKSLSILEKNSRRGVGFWVKDSIYFGMGERNCESNGCEVVKEFFAYNPNNCHKAIPKKLPKSIKERIDGIGFSLGGYGYLGLGKTDNRNVFSDIWQFDQITQSWDSIKVLDKSGLPIDTLRRQGAIAFSVNQDYAVIGGGYDANFNEKNDFWKFIPNPIEKTASLIPMGSLGIDLFYAGIGFSINENIYVGLSDDTGNDNFFKYDDGNSLIGEWKPVKRFPLPNFIDAVGFPLENRGYVVTGKELGGNNFNQSIWVYVPE